MIFEAFGIKRGDVVALVGAGGKTSAMFAMGNDACKKGFRVVLTTTTRIFHPGSALPVLLHEGREIVDRAVEALKHMGMVVAGAGLDEKNKIVGVDQALAGHFIEAGADLVLVESDGSAGRPFKAPEEWEPVIPGAATLVVPVVGIDCIGRSLSAENVHRPEVVAALTGIRLGQNVTAAMVAGVLGNSRGYRKNVPPGAGWVPFINKVETAADLRHARELAVLLGREGAGRVVIGAALSSVPVKEVVEF